MLRIEREPSQVDGESFIVIDGIQWFEQPLGDNKLKFSVILNQDGVDRLQQALDEEEVVEFSQSDAFPHTECEVRHVDKTKTMHGQKIRGLPAFLYSVELRKKVLLSARPIK